MLGEKYNLLCCKLLTNKQQNIPAPLCQTVQESDDLLDKEVMECEQLDSPISINEG